MKVLVTAFLPGLSLIKQREIARGLSLQTDIDGSPLFNVTLITGTDGSKMVDKSDTLRAYEIPITRASLLDELSPPSLLSFHTQSNVQVMRMFTNKAVILDEIREMEFDFLLTEGMPAAGLLARSLEVPHMIQASYMPDPLLSVLLNLPSQSSYNNPMLIPNTHFATDSGSKDRFHTISNILVRHGVPLAIPRYFRSDDIESLY